LYIVEKKNSCIFMVFLSLFSHKERKKDFKSSSKYKSFDPETTGTLSLKDYQSLEERNKYIELLEQYGLTKEEIQLKLQHEGYIPKVRIECTLRVESSSGSKTGFE